MIVSFLHVSRSHKPFCLIACPPRFPPLTTASLRHDTATRGAANGGEGDVIAPQTFNGLPLRADGSPGVVGMDDLCRRLSDDMEYPRRKADGPLYFAIDHCFPIKGQVRARGWQKTKAKT
jgi:hypothetical protein